MLTHEERNALTQLADEGVIRNSFPVVATALREIANEAPRLPGNGFTGDMNLYALAGALEDTVQNEGHGGSLRVSQKQAVVLMNAAHVLRWSARCQEAESGIHDATSCAVRWFFKSTCNCTELPPFPSEIMQIA